MSLQKFRISAGFSIQFIADRIGVSRQTVYYWEKGIKNPSSENLRKLANLFGVSMEEMIE